VLRGFEPGIRENVLLSRGFGVTKDDVLDEINAALIFGGMEAVEAVDRAVGDVFDTWT
jgi:hypothetical protein